MYVTHKSHFLECVIDKLEGEVEKPNFSLETTRN